MFKKYWGCTLKLLLPLFQANYIISPAGAPDIPKYRLVDVFMSCTDPIVKEAIIADFTEDSTLRVVVAMIAFGMGIDLQMFAKLYTLAHLTTMKDMFRKLVVEDVMVQRVKLFCRGNKAENLTGI